MDVRLAQLTDCYLPVINGITNLVQAHKAQLERLGHHAPVFTTGHRGFRDLDGDVHRSWGVPLGQSGYYAAPAYDRPAQLALAQADLLHAHHPFVAGRLALRYGRRSGQPVVYTNHTRLDMYAEVYVPRPLRGLTRWLLQRYMPRFAARCDLVIAPSESLAAVMRERWGIRTPLHVVPNGVELTRFRCPDAGSIRKDLALPANAVLALYTGRLGVEKNLGFLLRAFARAEPQRAGAHLVLLGDGPQADHLRALVARLGLGRRVILAGAVPYERVPAYLAAADLFVTASVSEVHPMSVIEALAAGLPVVGVRAPGLADTVQSGVNGVLTDHDPEAYAQGLRQALADADLRARLGAGACRSATCYSIERTTERILELYTALLEEGL
jgi:1,2-diacylglycerol 3-alpha-glucosyltransferase